ncbi:MAG: hypothetical protein UC390_05710 [Peptococcaceae bacterium]|nr:hypothetical protein [Peptococcaceae bacterium]
MARIIKALKSKNVVERREKELYVVDVLQLESFANGEYLEYH